MEEYLVELVEFDVEFLNLSWKWLKDKELRHLISATDISKDEQLIWYNNLKIKTDYLIWGINANHKPVGVTGLKKITKTDCEYWGYIGEREYWGKGIGVKIMELLENLARGKGLQSIWLKVNKDNIRAIKLYEKMMYRVEMNTEISIIMRKQL